MNHQTAFDENGKPTPVANFDYEAIDKNLQTDRKEIRRACRNGELSQEDFDRALALCGTLARWIFQSGRPDRGGLSIRAIIVCWHMLAEIRDQPLTQVALRFGKHKQSFGRWVDDFKKTFPRWRIAATRHATLR